LNKNKPYIIPSRLGFKMFFYFLISVGIGVGLYFLMNYFSSSFILSHMSNTSAIQDQTGLEVSDFQEYVTENGLATSDKDAISRWIFGEKYVFMNIYKNDYLVFSSSNLNYDKEVHISDRERDLPSYRRLYNVDFSDGTAQVGICLLAASKYYDAALLIELALSFFCFVVLFFFFISKEIRYVGRLKNELNIMGSGDLDHPITVRGNDEIAFLALDMEKMRLSFLERIKGEKEAKRANSELITSISHDLRTPLTILIGNLDIVADKKYKTGEQLDHYIASSRDKAYQIKELSDKLFEYFLVFGDEYTEPKLEPADCRELFTNILGGYALSLEDRGQEIALSSEIPECTIKINPIAVRRVFDNLFINILKYADPGVPVDLSFGLEGGCVSATLRNRIKKDAAKEKSTNIGLATCEKIMSQHHGTFYAAAVGDEFCATVRFPVVTPAGEG